MEHICETCKWYNPKLTVVEKEECEGCCDSNDKWESKLTDDDFEKVCEFLLKNTNGDYTKEAYIALYIVLYTWYIIKGSEVRPILTGDYTISWEKVFKC